MSTNFKKIEELKPDMKKINIEVKLIRKLKEREVYNKKAQKHQKVADFMVGDETGIYILTVWDAEIEKIESLIGKSIAITNGYITVFRDEAKLNIGKYGSWKFIEKEIQVPNVPKEEPVEVVWVKVADLKDKMSGVNIIVKINEVLKPRDVRFRDGTVHKVATASVGDTSGMINLSLFDNDIEGVKEGDIYELKNGYISKFQDTLQLNIGKYGNFKKIEHKDFKINTDKLF
ncbi:MAG: hypothetical protein ACTSRG_14320 [Candidatus Helarchaeota archaeon]